ncbi:oligomeric golgi complex component, COG2-domain-containing protein [Pseudomassariella vexata]|uniref:Conserved oligomeric Golgi complex subunit 2 n=1 Tax=Pseudomassariella vexata TaxID=1141098 RepID=A0A1Y2EKU1_9PEZI|nr:oligomeric golgi complex component, COG2-domain-containing protein [Pseudomassariella vexata]ORY72162.1 oligomeric golgi complex component, COG2-domain-containing protein [Pseudomassariella vexata]
MAALTSLSPTRPLSSRAFNLPSSSSSSDTEDDAPLPFPTALPRSDFLAPDFDPAAYLSELHSGAHRHQTLEDLRSDLRERSAAISGELLELVNANYTSFLSLGNELKGGEERVEDVRVGLLGFRRAVDEVRSKVGDRGREVGGLNKALTVTRGEIEKGRQMLELGDRIESLEDRLALNGADQDSLSEESEDDEADESEGNYGMVGSSAAKLKSLAHEYVAIEHLADRIGLDTVLVRKMGERMTRCRDTILLDLNTAIREARKVGDKGKGKVVRLMGVYALLDAQSEAVKALKAI